MRVQEKNKQPIYYALYQGLTEITDSDGLSTGEFENSYTAPTEIKVNVSANKGEAKDEMFGTDLNYSKKIVSATDLGWDENTILWIDKSAGSGSVITPHNFVVVAVAKSINSVTYAIKGVDVSNGD